MSEGKQKTGKCILVLSAMVLFLAAFCLLGGIAATIPAKTAQVYGPPDPALSTIKLYQQAVPLLLSREELLTPSDLGPENVQVPVNAGDTLDVILNRLVQLDLVQHPTAFRAYLIYSGIDTRIQTGQYRFSGEMSELAVAQALGNPAAGQTTLSILPGWRAEEIAATFPDIGLEADPDAFLQIVHSTGKEGYLFPGSYPVERDISPQALVDLFYQRFLSQISPEMENQFAAQGLTIQQGVILASILQREAVVPEEMPQIASVYLNRLRADMNLSADPTIQYALGYDQEGQTWWTNPLSLDDLKLPSSYNTYQNPGLPPGPICNPGLEALQAVAQPASTPYLYFRAACDGTGLHLFSETYQEHLDKACP